MGQQQGAGGAERQLVGLLLPVAAEQKLAIKHRDFRVAGEGFFIQRDRRRAFIPDLLTQFAQVLVSAVEMHKG
ncbi:hypothetical protein D3C81_2064180 [compost metagenome]